MTEKEKMLNNYLLRIASNLDISETMREKAETSYRAVGQWLGDAMMILKLKLCLRVRFTWVQLFVQYLMLMNMI